MIESDNLEPKIIGPQKVTPFTFKNTIKEGVSEEVKVDNLFSLKKIKESEEERMLEQLLVCSIMEFKPEVKSAQNFSNYDSVVYLSK